jgi:DNA-directed RNA polymerase specialized sigma24 family protein
MRVIGGGVEVEDLLQQVFLQLHRASSDFRAESTVSAFIGGIARDVALDHLRRQRRLRSSS